MNIKKETADIIKLLSAEQIEWGEPYSYTNEWEGWSYTVSIPAFDDDQFLEDNLTQAEADILLQLSEIKGARRNRIAHNPLP